MTRLLSNLIKSNVIYINREKRIIEQKTPQSFGATALRNTVGIEDPLNTADNIQNLMEVSSMERLLKEEQELLGEKVDSMLRNAREQANAIIAKASEEAKSLKELAIEEGKKAGYVKGFEEGAKAIRELETNLKEQALAQKMEYETAITNIEPMFVEVMVGLIENITGVLIEDKKDVITHLIHRAILNTEKSKEFLIKVSKEDYEFVKSNLERLHSSLAEDVVIDVYEDVSLNKNQCFIECEHQIIECSLDIQLSNLIMDLRLLANIKA